MSNTKKTIRASVTKRKQLRAKQLLATADYITDLEAYEKTQKGVNEMWSKEWSSKTKAELAALLDTKHQQYMDIRGKYKLTKPYSLDFLKGVSRGLNEYIDTFNYKDLSAAKQLLLDGSFETTSKDGSGKFCYSILAVTPDRRHLTVAIDPLANRGDIHFQIDEILDLCQREFEIKKEDRRFREGRLRDLEVYRLRALGKTLSFPVLDRREMETGEYRQTVKAKTYAEIGLELGITKETARKAFYRAHQLIHGAPYEARAKVKIERPLLKKDCNTCGDRASCKELCPDILSFVEQGMNRTPFEDAVYEEEKIDDVSKEGPLSF